MRLDEKTRLDFGLAQVTQYIYTFLFTTELILRVWDAFWTVPKFPGKQEHNSVLVIVSHTAFQSMAG